MPGAKLTKKSLRKRKKIWYERSELTMKIECYISEECSSEAQLRENLKAALAGSSVKPDIQFHIINEAEAERKGLMGSPSVLINGVDILPGEIPGIS